jgi:hypothetical protein
MKPWIPIGTLVLLITTRPMNNQKSKSDPKDMVRVCALQYRRSWNKSLPCAEFFDNNNYEESLKMAPFEMLYGHRCRTPLFWNETRERKVFGPDILQGAEIQVRMVRENLKIAPSR